MARINAGNERLKRDYIHYLKEARGKSEASLDMVRKALLRFETSTGWRDFKTFRPEQARAFKQRLAETESVRNGEPLSATTQTATLTAVKDFFLWLAWRPGFKSKLHMADIDYLNPSRKDAAKARASKLRDYPSLEQIRAALAAMPTETPIERRNRALLAFAILTGMRDRAIASVSLRDLDLTKSPPLVRQDPNRVETKFAKAINTYFFPLGDDLAAMVTEWVRELREVHLFGPTDPLFPRTRIGRGADLAFAPQGIERTHWNDASPIRAIFKQAFTRAGLSYFPPHSFRHTLGHLAQTMCRTPEELRAWSQNLGHENIATTFSSYGKIDPHRQGEVIGAMAFAGARDDDAALIEISAILARRRVHAPG